MDATTQTSWRRRAVVAGVVLLCCAGSGAAGARLFPRTVRVVEYKDRIQTVEHQVIVEKPVDRWHDRVVEKIVYRKDGSKASETTTTETGGSHTGGSETTTDTKVDETRTGSVTTTVSPEGRWSVRVLAGPDSAGSVVAGAGVDYRFLGPATAGVEVLAPVAGNAGRFTFLFGLGLRL